MGGPWCGLGRRRRTKSERSGSVAPGMVLSGLGVESKLQPTRTACGGLAVDLWCSEEATYSMLPGQGHVEAIHVDVVDDHHALLLPYKVHMHVHAHAQQKCVCTSMHKHMHTCTRTHSEHV